ncbi:hypothetical protein SAMN05444156_2014 [Verrucomicrobium sp. GAS474]|uniref:NAD(P)/FAD-dependent oxidoreductase n=1 Tax=Verrucomicrobium sp. GAS474 TaxID=1882831 RepID=UPI0008798635|nr:NAD(P)/FAD-dependent oxidoreductase [Verrucomicrobium sp. GAS474]SDU11045.1 hypothetical protein SAMN05444156_2014 [Verrucomicrobium sp. GAS474]
MSFPEPAPLQEADVVVLGGGAAGLMCAITAGQRGRRVVVLEGNERIGKKILISGGGRCNFTNTGAGPGNYLSGNPGFCRSALARYTPRHFLEFVERRGIAWHEKKLGQLFCDHSSKEIVDMLEAECAEAGVEIVLNGRATAVGREGSDFIVETRKGKWRCGALVVATGGLSIPKIGAEDFGYRVARHFKVPLTATRPGLVPLTSPDRTLHALSGLSLPVAMKGGGGRFEENLLFTHRGVSGPAVLQISSFWQPGEEIEVDLLPGMEAAKWLRAVQREPGGTTLRHVLATKFPRRLADAWADREGEWADRPINGLKGLFLDELGARLNRWMFRPDGTEGYAKAEVTLGGVDTGALSSKTFEAREVPGLFFIGEVVDVTGWLGGYNFQWAWASGHAAGESV